MTSAIPGAVLSDSLLSYSINTRSPLILLSLAIRRTSVTHEPNNGFAHCRISFAQ